MTKKNKKFDCVEMMHQGGERIRREVEGMTLDEEVEYWKKRTDSLRREMAAYKNTRKAS